MLPETHMVQVVIGVLSRTRKTTDVEYLVGRRSGKAYTGCWEFPGGKVEAGENPEDALVREWVEELGLGIIVGVNIFDRQFSTTDLTNFQALAYRVDSSAIALTPRLAVHDTIEWMSRTEILALADDHCTPSLKGITSVLP